MQASNPDDKKRGGKQLFLAAKICASLAGVIGIVIPLSYIVFRNWVNWESTSDIGAIMGWLLVGLPASVLLAITGLVLLLAAGQRL